MGETPTQRIEITFAPDAIAEFVRTVGELAGQRSAPAGPALTNDPYDLGLEPWLFYDPHQKIDTMAYVDDRNQVRHVPSNRATEVPKAWRRVWLEPRE